MSKNNTLDSHKTLAREINAPAHTPDILTDKQVDYAIAQMVERAQNGPFSGFSALIRHFRDLAVTDRTEQAKEDAEKCLGALAAMSFGQTSRVQFLEDFKIDTGENGADEDDEERVKPQAVEQTVAARQRLADAIVEIATNKSAPAELRNPVSDFLMGATTDLWDEMREDPVFVERALQRLEPV